MAIKVLTFAVFFALTSVLSAINLSSNLITYKFSLPLIHRDAINSPLYDKTLSNSDQIKNVITRSILRAELLSNNSNKSFHDSNTNNTNLTEIIFNRGEYFISISIGTPSFQFLAMIDSCSNDTWLGCKFCENCNEQNPSLFDPIKSSTFRPALLRPSDPSYDIHQLYSLYGSNTELNFQETLSVGYPTIRANLSFDCKFTNQETFSTIGSGVIGLQLKNQKLDVPRLLDVIGSTFSYCLVPLATINSENNIIQSTITFGKFGVVSGNGVVSTPIVIDDNVTNNVKLTLKAITIGKKRIEWNTKPVIGNIMIDIGTTLLMLQSIFYDAVESEIRNQVNTTRIDDPLGKLKLCYNSDGFKPPKLIMNFNGANIELNDYNSWVATSDDVICFAAAPSNMTIYGNLAQTNFLIGHDMKESTVNFKFTKCR